MKRNANDISFSRFYSLDYALQYDRANDVIQSGDDDGSARQSDDVDQLI